MTDNFTPSSAAPQNSAQNSAPTPALNDNPAANQPSNPVNAPPVSQSHSADQTQTLENGKTEKAKSSGSGNDCDDLCYPDAK